MSFKLSFLKKAAACLCGLALTAAVMPGLGGNGGNVKNSLMNVSAASTVNNPIIWSDVPDCDVIRVGDTYYMISTTMFFSPGAPIMKSKDLVSWEICSYVYDTLADGDVQKLTNGKHDYAHGQWAASLRYHDGNFYVFFGSYGTGKSYIYKTNDIENGKWTRSELNGMYHDASILFDDDGRNYLVYGGGGEIKIKEFNSEMTDFKWGGLEKTIFKTGLDNLAGEGSHIQKIGDYYYVFIIAWPSTSGRIELCYRSKSLTGNFEGKTVLNSGVGSYGSGVAQGGIVDTPDGKWYGLLFQDHGSVGRIPVLVPVTWQDNWPIMGVNGKAPITITVDGNAKGTHLAKSDSFDYSENKLALEWQWNHNPDNTAWSVTEREGWLRLTNKTIAKGIIQARNTLTQRTEGPSCSSVIKLDTSGMKAGDHAGLSAFQYKYGNVGVRVGDDGSKKIYMAENGAYGSGDILGSSDKIVEEVGLNGNEIYLKLDFHFADVKSDMSSSNNIDKVNFYYSYDGSSWKKIGSELSMTYDLKMFTGYRSGIYSYATKNLGGYADIDFFDYENYGWNVPEIIEPDDRGWYFVNGFEEKTEGWNPRGGASVAVSSDASFVGSKSIFVTERTASWNGAMRALNPNAFVPGQEYSFSANVMFPEGDATDDFFMKLQYVDASGETNYSTIAEGTAVKGEWMQLANTNYKIPEDATDMYLYVETVESTNDFYVDEVIGAVGGTGILGAAPPVTAVPGDYDKNGVIDAYDMVLARQAYIAHLDGADMPKMADVDKSGTFKINDLVLLSQYILGAIDEFPDNSNIE